MLISEYLTRKVFSILMNCCQPFETVIIINFHTSRSHETLQSLSVLQNNTMFRLRFFTLFTVCQHCSDFQPILNYVNLIPQKILQYVKILRYHFSNRKQRDRPASYTYMLHMLWRGLYKNMTLLKKVGCDKSDKSDKRLVRSSPQTKELTSV